MVLYALGFLIGVAAFQQLSQLPPWYWGLPVLMLIPVAIRYPKGWPLLFVGGGFCWSLLFAHGLLAQDLAPELEGQNLIAEGVISALPTTSPERTRFEFTINTLWKIDNNPGVKLQGPANKSASSDKDTGRTQAAVIQLAHIPGKVLLNWYDPPTILNVGQTWRLLIRVKRPHGFRNPGGFDYEAWLARHGIRATGYVKTLRLSELQRYKVELPARISSLNTLMEPGPGRYYLGGSRQWLRSHMDLSLQDSEFRGIISALTIGERNAISKQQWRVFTATGTNHLIAISGLHIGLIAGLAFFVMRWWWSRWRYATLRIPAQKVAAITAILFAFGYAALAGFAIPTQRALAMVVVVMLSIWLQRKVPPSHVLSVALLVVLLIDPFAVLSSGFWLSFAAVSILLYGMAGRLAPKGLWWRWGRAQWLVFLGLAPLLLWFFQNVAWVAPFANIVAIPWVSFLTVPLSLLGAVLLPLSSAAGADVLYLADLSLQGLWPFLNWLASAEHPAWLAIKPPLWTIIPAVIGIVWSLAPQGVPARWVGMIWLLPMFVIKVEAIPNGDAQFTLLDVGQGLAAVIKTHQHVLVYDSGPRFSTGFDTGNAVVVPYLRYLGVQKIDRFVISHGDNDHIGGAASILEALPVDQLYTSVVNEFTPGLAQSCVSGQQWQWDGVKFQFLSPKPDDYGRETIENNLSCVLLVETPSSKVLLAGDIERGAEHKLVAGAEKSDISADILVMPHHGSKTSSTMPFIQRVAPKYALAAVGYKNRFGFPKPEVVERYLQNHATVMDTAQYGAISFLLHRDHGVELEEEYRLAARHYWNTDLGKWYSF